MEQPQEGDQQLPVKNERPDIQGLVMQEMSSFGLPCVDVVRHDLRERREVGIGRYGTPLQPFNGRDALRDLYEELLDAVCYARQSEAEVKEQSDGRLYQILHQTYTDLLARACTIRMLMEERDAGPQKGRQRAPQQVSDAPRPERLGADPRAEVAEIRETADLWRVYLEDWVIVYTSDATGEKGVAETQKLFDEKYLGRVHHEHVIIYSHGPKYSAVLKLYLPVLRGEFKYREQADDEAQRLGGAEVVQRNSAADYKLREYGVKKVAEGS